ncbi:hypothetical protein AB4Y64_17630 [Lysobacter sp. TAF61]|uniref:hypothetical protein n=1 Tax=Lysobacter sp. TAF61 TaxID=3233072 RepID=UPI003F949853
MSSFVVAFAVPLALALLGLLARPNARREADAYIVEFSVGFRAMTWVFVGLAVAVAVAAFFVPRDAGYVLGIAGLFAFIGTPLWLHGRLTRFQYGAEGIVSLSPWRKARFMAWEDIARVSYSRGEQSYVLVGRDGAKFKPHDLMSGIPDLMAELQRRNIQGAMVAQASRDFR